MKWRKERETNNDPRNEKLRREVEELKKWREWENKEKGKARHIQDPEAAGTSQERKQEKRSWKELEWITEEKEREKRRNNIVGMESTKRYSSDDIENWLETEIEIKAKIEKYGG